MTWWIGTILNASSRDLSYLMQTNGNLLMIKIIMLIFIALRIISIIWVAKDVSSRTNNAFLQILNILCVTLLSPILWLPLYLAIRPVHDRHDTMPRRESLALKTITCYNCHTLNLKKNKYCSNCGEPLKLPCKKCWKKNPYHYAYCTDCGSPNFDN